MPILGALGAIAGKSLFGKGIAALGGALTSGAGVSAMGGLASDLISNRGAMRRQMLADQNNIRFWKMQNEYNLPVNQMKRLQQAGLNPNLIYGSGSANTGVAGSISPSKAAPYNVKNPVPLQAMMMQAQINNLNSVTAKNDAETARTLGLTPFQVNTSMSKADQAKQQAVAERIKTSVLSETKQDQINKIAEEALLAKAKKTEAEAKAEFTKKMLKMNVNPNSGIGSQVIQLIFGTADDAINYFRSGEFKNSGILN